MYSKLIANFQLPFTFSASDYPEPDSFAVSVYMMGCENNCAGCFNVKFQDYSNKENTKKMNLKQFVSELEDFCRRSQTNKVVLLGGDPLFKKNISFVKKFLEIYSEQFEICIYTGYNIQQVKNNQLAGFKFLKTGLFIQSEKQPSFKEDSSMQFASANQKLYDKNYTLISSNGLYNFV
ncbi:MAG: 4Fe-4S cluster-binding domain-containing protein [Alphaproteobacteria bacterium]|nr:4Fe-4S cluster-binding domain-containing protein [Rickettsiales bacterium]